MTLRSLIYFILTLVLTAAPSAARPASSSSQPRWGHCRQSASRSRLSSPLLAEFHSRSWRWFVACDEAAWKKVDHIGFTRKCQSRPLNVAGRKTIGHLYVIKCT
jgi:hypothetical protein